MLVRFAIILSILTAIALMTVRLEKQNLAHRRAISRQHYEMDILQERRSRLILECQQLTAPAQLEQPRTAQQERLHVR